MNKKYTLVELNEEEHFDKHASTYDVNYNYLKPFTKYKIAKKSKDFVTSIKKHTDKDKLNILEIGCGTGEYTKHIARLMPNAKITALDISQQMVNEAKEKCKNIKNIKFVVKSVFSSGLPKKNFDVICGFYVLHHIDEKKLAKESYELLNDNGLMYFFEPNILNPVVYLIKSNNALKMKAGDSPDEWAINPISIKNNMRGFTPLSITTSEFIWPIDILPLKILRFLDKMTSVFRCIPLVMYFGGSVQLLFKKNGNVKVD